MHFRPIYRFSYFKETITKEVKLHITDKLADEVITLPLYPGMTMEEVEYVANHVRMFLLMDTKRV